MSIPAFGAGYRTRSGEIALHLLDDWRLDIREGGRVTGGTVVLTRKSAVSEVPEYEEVVGQRETADLRIDVYHHLAELERDKQTLKNRLSNL